MRIHVSVSMLRRTVTSHPESCKLDLKARPTDFSTEALRRRRTNRGDTSRSQTNVLNKQVHQRKVRLAHNMWHIATDSIRSTLSKDEIILLHPLKIQVQSLLASVYCSG